MVVRVESNSFGEFFDRFGVILLQGQLVSFDSAHFGLLLERYLHVGVCNVVIVLAIRLKVVLVVFLVIAAI